MAPGPVNFIPQTPRASGGEPVSLAQIAAAGITLPWHEALALIQQICRALIAQRGHFNAESSRVAVQSSGDVTIQPDAGGDADTSVQSLGELLRNWLADTPYPMPLRHVIAQATCTPPFYTSVTELSEALSHYERSDARDLARALYER